MWQTLIVALIVAAAVLHFSTRYLPAAMRRAILRGLVRCGRSEEKMSQLFKVAPGCGSGCGACGSCDTPAPPAAGDGGAGKKRVIMMQVQR